MRSSWCPTLYTVADAAASRVASYVDGGGHAVVTYFSGIADKDNHIRLGGYPGAFRDLLGVRFEEFCPLPEGGTVRLSDGSVGSVWSERGRVTTAEVVATYADGPAVGSPAITRATSGSGTAWYVGTRLDADGWENVLRTAAQEAGVQPVVEAPAGLEAVRRVAADGTSWLFLLNHLDSEVTVPATGTDLLTGHEVDGTDHRDSRWRRGRERAHVNALAPQRQQRILEEVRRRGGVRVSDLVDLLGVSDMTIRRDLDVLARRGLLHKVHGGATASIDHATDEPGFAAKSGRELQEKTAMARAAAELVEPGTAVGPLGRHDHLGAGPLPGQRPSAHRRHQLHPGGRGVLRLRRHRPDRRPHRRRPHALRRPGRAGRHEHVAVAAPRPAVHGRARHGPRARATRLPTWSRPRPTGRSSTRHDSSSSLPTTRSGASSASRRSPPSTKPMS